MAREVADAGAIVSRELAKFGVQNMEYSSFMANAELSQDERKLIAKSLVTRQNWIYLDVSGELPALKVGKFEVA